METTTRTQWAEGLSVGWIELIERETGKLVRHEFGDCKIISVSEKMSGTGKRLLLGLDTPESMPIDVYFTCAEKEIQLTVEASRDTKTHTLYRIGLLPGLCGGVDSYVLPVSEGRLVFPNTLPEGTQEFSVWTHGGLFMPFIGAIKTDTQNSALAVMTDSAYAIAELSRATCDWIFARDPERRRLEVRLVLLPDGDHVAIARTYRDKLVSERAHVTLRKKARDNPSLGDFLQSENASLEKHLSVYANLTSDNRWEEIESLSEKIADSSPIKIITGNADWAIVHADARRESTLQFLRAPIIPLFSVVHRDAIVDFVSLVPGRSESLLIPFLRCLLRMSYPAHPTAELYTDSSYYPYVAILESLLKTIYRLTYAAFLKSHRFLTEDLQVQEAIYTDKTRVVVNFSESKGYSCEEFELPPLGFIVFHSQLKAHDALRVGEERFVSREIWIIRSGTV